MGRATHGVVLVIIGAVSALLAQPAWADRLLVPGGAASLRRITGIPEHVPDSMLLSEAARAWYGVREPVPADARHAAALIQYITSPKEPLEPGPWLPLSAATWMRLLGVKSSGNLAAALVRSRDAMLLYRGLTGADDRTLTWLDTQPDLLSEILEHTAPAFATVGPSFSVTDQGIAVPGGPEAAEAWRELAGAAPSEPARFIRSVLERDHSRIAWMFSTISALDPAQAKLVVGEGGNNLRRLASHFVEIAPEWNILDRAFSRPIFDPAVALMLLRPTVNGSFAGSEEFWRAVFKGAPPHATGGAPLTVARIIDILFEDPSQARAHWELFALGQRMLRTAQPDRDTWAALTAAARFPAVALSLERIGALSPVMMQQVTDAAARITKSDPDGRRGDLAAWQAAFASIERAALNGGIDARETASMLTSLTNLRLASPRRDLTAWFMDVWLEHLVSRPAAPKDAEEALLRTMAGDLRATGERDDVRFTWEDLPYTLATEHRGFVRMQEARAAQGGPTLNDAYLAWKGRPQDLTTLSKRLAEASEDSVISAAAKRVGQAVARKDFPGLERDRRDLADALLGRVLPFIAYVSQQAATDDPALGGDIALRHEIMIPEESEARRRRPWQLAVEVAVEGKPWHMAGSLLSLDIPLSDWYLRPNGDAPMSTPMLEEPDVNSMALVAVLGTSVEIERLADTIDAIEKGRHQVAASSDAGSATALLASRGIDPWRRRALEVDASSPSDIALRLTPSEAWRIGLAAPVALVPGLALDGCPCLVETPFAPTIAEGRPSNGMIGAVGAGLALRIATFLKSRGLPLALFRSLAGGVAFDVIHTANGVRTDDLLALDATAARITDARLEEHVLALIADGTLATPAADVVR